MNTNYELAQDRHPEIYTAEGENITAHTHFHKKIELLYVLRGEKKVTVGNSDITVKQNNVVIIDSYQLHSFDEGGVCLSITLPTAFCERYLQYRKNKILRSNIIDDPDYCARNLLPYFTAIMRRNELDHYSLQANVDMLLSGICSIVGFAPNNYSLEGVGSILAYIEQNYDKELTLTALANHFGYSKYYFSRMFNEMFHTSLNDYLSVIRLQHTFSYYSEHDCSITAAALKCGFGSMPTFYRVLKKNNSEYSLKNLKNK